MNLESHEEVYILTKKKHGGVNGQTRIIGKGIMDSKYSKNQFAGQCNYLANHCASATAEIWHNHHIGESKGDMGLHFSGEYAQQWSQLMLGLDEIGGAARYCGEPNPADAYVKSAEYIQKVLGEDHVSKRQLNKVREDSTALRTSLQRHFVPMANAALKRLDAIVQDLRDAYKEKEAVVSSLDRVSQFILRAQNNAAKLTTLQEEIVRE